MVCKICCRLTGSGWMFYFVIFIQTAINTGVGVGAILLAGECLQVSFPFQYLLLSIDLLLNYYTLNSFEVNFLSFSNQDTHIKENINTSEDYSDIYQWKQRVIIYTLSYLHYNKKKKDIFHTHEKKLVNFIKLNHL